MFIAGTFTDCFLKTLPLALVVHPKSPWREAHSLQGSGEYKFTQKGGLVGRGRTNKVGSQSSVCESWGALWTPSLD